VIQHYERDEIDGALLDLLARFAPSVVLDPAYCHKLIAAVFEKLKQFAPIFEINVATNSYCRAVQAWIDIHPVAEQAETPVANSASS
jgi:hypothetical protein